MTEFVLFGGELLFEELTKESDLIQHPQEVESHLNRQSGDKSTSDILGSQRQGQFNSSTELMSLMDSVQNHKLFKEGADEASSAQHTTMTSDEFDRDFGMLRRERSTSVMEVPSQRNRSHSVFEALPSRSRRNAMYVPMDNSTMSLLKIRSIVIEAKEKGDFDSQLTYKKEKGFFEKLKGNPSSTMQEVGKNIKSGVTSSLKERFTSKFGETVKSSTEKLGELNGYREKLQEALSNNDIETVKLLIQSKMGESKPLNFIMKAVEWVCKTFGGEKGDSVSKGLGILEKIGFYGGPIGTGIKTIQSGYESVKKVYTLFKNRHENSNNVQEVSKVVSESLESVSEVVDSVKGTLEKLDVFKSVFTSVLPIIGSAIQIGANAASIIVKVYDAIKAFNLRDQSANLVDSFATKGSLSKFMVEKSGIFSKYMKIDKKSVQTRSDELNLKKQVSELSQEEMDEHEDLKGFLLYKHLKSHNKKRGVRSVILIGEKLVSIGAEIASIVGVATQGVGTAVGTAMKAAVTVEQVARKAYNVTKQLGRDYMPEKINFFDKDKSTEQKARAYYQNTYTILDRIGKLPMYLDHEDIKGQYELRQLDLKLANCNVTSLAQKEKLEDIRDFLINSMKQRE